MRYDLERLAATKGTRNIETGYSINMKTCLPKRRVLSAESKETLALNDADPAIGNTSEGRITQAGGEKKPHGVLNISVPKSFMRLNGVSCVVPLPRIDIIAIETLITTLPRMSSFSAKSATTHNIQGSALWKRS